MYIVLIILALIFLLWANLKWKCEYFVSGELKSGRTYTNKSIFFTPFRKIYRPGEYSKQEYDIFLLQKVNRLTKKSTYSLCDLDDYVKELKDLKGDN